jgi:ubiquitin-protein ligase
VELKDKSELLVWRVMLTGPEKSPYDKGVFELEVDLRQEYPFKHPQVKFATKVYHPNVNRTDGERVAIVSLCGSLLVLQGTVCEEMLSHNWSPQTQMKEVLQKIFGETDSFVCTMRLRL